MWSNCLIEAWIEYRTRIKRWKVLDRPVGQEPYWVIRPSRHAPRWIRHRLVGRWKDCPHCGGGIHVESYKPTVPEHLPWWRAWRHIFYRGRWVAGDKHTEH